jgi:hypothetical protein
MGAEVIDAMAEDTLRCTRDKSYDDTREVWRRIAKQTIDIFPESPRYPLGKGDADVLSIFDRPSGNLNRCATEQGLYAMPPVDKIAVPPTDILDDVQFVMLTHSILEQRTALVIIAPDCGAWCAAAQLNNNRPSAMVKITIWRDEQRRVMKRVNALVVAVQAYGGHVLIENPASSSFWHQDFMKDIERDMPTAMTWHDIIVNFCRVGSEYFKPVRCCTMTPPEAIAHMEGLICNHAFKYPRCVGRDGDGVSRTKAT